MIGWRIPNPPHVRFNEQLSPRRYRFAGQFQIRQADVRRIVDADHHAQFQPPSAAKQLITFLKRPHELPVSLPLEGEGAAICKLEGVEVYSHYLPNDKGPLFMTMLEKTFGKQITTRTVDTVRKCIKA